MEPIPEEEMELAALTSARTVKREQKSRLTEVYTSQQVDTLVSTVPESAVPDSWKLANDEVYIDPSMSSTYVTEALAGPTSARGSTYSYTYESHYDEPPQESEDEEVKTTYAIEGDDEVERLSTQTQKITRVTKVTTTRSVRQLPMAGSDSNFYFDAEGSPMPIGDASSSIYENVPYSDTELLALGIELSRDKNTKRASSYDTPPPAPSNAYENEIYTSTTTSSQYDVPGTAGVPHVSDVGSHEVELVWLRPDSDGRAGPLLGYRVEIRRVGSTTGWESAHDLLIKDTRCTISNLDSMAEYEFRVLAANSAGFGPPSSVSAIVQLRPHFDSSHLINGNGAWRGTIPGRPYVNAMDMDRVTIGWAPAIADPDTAPVAGYQVEYRAVGAGEWIQSNDYLVVDCQYEVQNLRPNGEYEFRVRARSADGISEASPSSGIVRIKPCVPSRGPSSLQSRVDVCPPGQPQVEEVDSDWVQLHWAEGGEPSDQITYVVEYREIGDPLWYKANATPIQNTVYTVTRLRASSTYEFRVIARCSDGTCSAPSPVSDLVQLRPSTKSTAAHGVPSKPSPPEYVDFESGDRVTLCWFPAASSLPIEGYDVEFRDYQQDSAWYKVNELLIHSCKMTVGDLINGHEYQFRLIARNALGYSEPSDPSPPMLIGAPTNGDSKYVEAERYGSVSLLQDEMVRESPPIPDRDDSPPPFHRTHMMRGNDGLHWRDPTLREVIEYLDSTDKVEQLNAAGYLQHLTFNDNAIKEETRELKGIPKLVKLLGSDVPDIQKNACGCLKNLAFGKENDNNKRGIRSANGISALTALLRQTPDAHVREEATAALWNLSSSDDLKPVILEQCADAIVQNVIMPGSGIEHPTDATDSLRSHSSVFRNGAGVLRNVSAANVTARRTLRASARLIDSLVHYLTRAVLNNQVDSRAVENVVCVLRNLSYRIQEVQDPNYDPRAGLEGTDRRERSRSAPSGSPKTRKKEAKKKKKALNDHNARGNSAGALPSGAELLWQPELVKLYLRLLQESSNSDTLEASAGAIQNLAACEFEPSIAVRACVRTEKGLPVLVELLRLNDDKVVCAVTTALRNLALDQRNRELIGKYAMRDLVSKLPRADQKARDGSVGDATTGAVLGILFETVKHSADFTRNVHECGGTERLRYLARSHPMYSARICKYASQVLYVMWQHKELHDGFKRSGLKEADFYSGTTATRARDTTTLARPISSQGAERPANLRSENMDDSGSGSGTGRYGAMGSTCSVAANADYARSTSSERSVSRNLTPQYQAPPPHYPTPPYQQQLDEPLYASVHKRNGHRGSTGGDSWV